jgi:hypothetical protein
MSVKGHDGTFTAYIARPEELPTPAVIVLQELFGVNADIREKCDELALGRGKGERPAKSLTDCVKDRPSAKLIRSCNARGAERRTSIGRVAPSGPTIRTYVRPSPDFGYVRRKLPTPSVTTVRGCASNPDISLRSKSEEHRIQS